MSEPNFSLVAIIDAGDLYGTAQGKKPIPQPPQTPQPIPPAPPSSGTKLFDLDL